VAAFKILFRRARTLLWTAFSILVILAAVLVGIGKLLMPYSERYQPHLEAWLSEEFGRPVELDSFTGEWTAFGPRLSLQGMNLLPAGQTTPDHPDYVEAAVAIEAAALDIKPLNALLPGRPLYNFRVIGADFELRRTDAGRFELSGFGVTQRGGENQGSALKELARVGEVVLQDSSLVYQDEKFGVLLGFSGIGGWLRLKGDELAIEFQASFHDPRSGMVYGDIDATALMTLDGDQKVLDLAWQASAKELMLAAFQGRLPQNPFLPLTGWLNAELWGEWSRSSGHLVKGVTDLRDARLANEYQDLQLDRVNTRFRWQLADKGNWNLHLADFLFDDGSHPWTAPRISMARNTSEGLGLWISADQLPLEVPLNLARDVMLVYQTVWPAFLPRRASGNVSGLDLVLDENWGLKLARGSVKQASVLDWDRWPDLQGLDAEVALRSGSGRLSISGTAVAVDWPGMFRDSLSFTIPSCNVDLNWGQQWQVGFSNCSLHNGDIAAEAEIVISGDDGKPAVDVNAAITRGDIASLGAYWPEAILKENVKGWLRRGLLSGEIVNGRLQINGDMDDWPFRHGKGRFEAVAKVANGRIDYFEGWPQAGSLTATAHFLGAAMDIRGDVGDIGGVSVRSVTAGIADLKTPVLTVGYSAESELPKFLAFLQQTPLNDQIKVDLSDFSFAGVARTTGNLIVPLGSSPGELALDGKVDLPGGYFSDPGTGVTLDGIVGELHYDEKGFTGIGLESRFRGHPAKLDIAAGVDLEEKFRADLSGVFGVREVIPEFLLESYAELARVDGNCRWDVSLLVAPGVDSDETETLLTVKSELIGVELALPAPLNKRAGDHWPLELRFPLSGQSRLLDVEFKNRATLRFDLPENLESPRSAVIRLGTGLPAMAPDGYIRIDGSSQNIDLDGWIDVIVEGAMQGQGMGGLELEKGSISAQNLLFLDRNFDDVNLDFNVVESDISAEFSAEAIMGKVRFTSGESGMSSLSAEFERLALGDPVTSGMDMESNPADLPALHLYAKSFQYAGVELGETRIEAYPTANGFHFEKVDASSDQLSVQASGDWSLDEEGQRSDFDIHMASESLGEFLQSMDISSSIEGGQTLVDFNAWWPGSPATFALSRLNGEVVFSVVDGNITNASSGTGRLLGLLSIQALPKRLSLDFRDVFDSGFSFDEATGTFMMENGRARTDDLLLKSSSASISVSGSTNLVDQQYDQLLTIRPGLGNTLPIIGALAAGPPGAAAGLALQGLLHSQLGEATQVQYTITGDWDNPDFEAVDVKRVESETLPGSKENSDSS
jgi:uncharacterized protein (TIGR02099 family)